MNNNKNKTIMVVVVLATIFGLASGFVGELLARTYLFSDIFNLPFYGEINLNSQDYRPNLTIRDAKNVVVEQDVKAIDTLNAVGNVMIGIYGKDDLINPSEVKSGQTGFSATSSYIDIHREAGQGLIITSDGWIITSFIPEGYKPGMSDTDVKKILDKYLVVTKDKNVYTIDRVESDPITPIMFIHVATKDFSVRGFAPYSELASGRTVLAADWLGRGNVTDIVGRDNQAAALSESSDKYNPDLILADNPQGIFNGAFLFNLNGDVDAIIDNDGKIYPIAFYTSAINSLLKQDKLQRPSLGVNYIMLSDLVSYSGGTAANNPVNDGALITGSGQAGLIGKSASAGAKAGVMSGDIITSINNVGINKDNPLDLAVQQFIPGEDITLGIIRNNELQQVKVKLE